MGEQINVWTIIITLLVPGTSGGLWFLWLRIERVDRDNAEKRALLWVKINELAAALGAYQLKVAETYVNRPALTELKQDLDNQFGRVFAELKHIRDGQRHGAD
jgi:hypothetical protein